MEISENCKLRGVVDEIRPLESLSYILEFSSREFYPSVV
jgi:hypothetical protein